MILGLDFETYGTRDLRKVGLDNYLSDPEFRPLIGSVSTTKLDGTTDTEVELDFVSDHDGAIDMLLLQLGDHLPIAVHNAGFERGVLRRMGLSFGHGRFVDSAVAARAAGADSHLANAAAQMLTGTKKMEEGKSLIKKWSTPNAEGLCEAEQLHKQGLLQSNTDWQLFQRYCNRDARLAKLLAMGLPEVLPAERSFEIITQRMNDIGWNVDLVAVRRMYELYEQNKAYLMEEFRNAFDPKGTLNINSLKQLKAWCAERGVKATSFDEQHVASMLKRVETKLIQMGLTPGISVPPSGIEPLEQVYQLLKLKQTFGGSSLKKLEVILNMVSEDGRLRNSYMHYGASQSGRTSGKGVQMQNLPRLHGGGRDMSSLYAGHTAYWTNDDLSANLRQVFTATHPGGALIVGDFKSVESRALGYLAGETWKVQAYTAGKDLYRVLAAKMFNLDYYAVSDEQRQTGKVGELACGYGSGNVAVKDFAKKMGVEMSDEESGTLVNDWRETNPKVVDMWDRLNEAMRAAVLTKTPQAIELGVPGIKVRFMPILTPQSLLDQHPGVVSLEMDVRVYGVGFKRYFHGCYSRGRNICFYRASGKANGDMWSPWYTDPKTKGRKYHNLYGGKLAAVITQSFCREIFFAVADNVQRWCDNNAGVRLIGQFHDELVLDFNPAQCSYTLAEVEQIVTEMMSTFTALPGFPLAAEVKSNNRYIK